MNKTIVVAYGDGIGPEIMSPTLLILKEAGALINIESIEIGQKQYEKGYSSGIAEEAWEKLRQHKILLKAPITTPQGKGYKSLNVTFRKGLGLFANVRPCTSYAPFVQSLHKNVDMVIVRENEEDLYAGIEYQPALNSTIAHKIISRSSSEKIIRYAFEYAKANNRKKVTCMIKDNIMKISDGLFHSLFKEIAQEYPEIASNSSIIDIGAARIASRPHDFDVIVTLNLYGDIISDIAAEVTGSVGFAGSANIGADAAMFEAVHGSAPDIAGQGIANPSGLLNSAIYMLEHIAQYEVAARIKNAWLKTIEDGIHTADVFSASSKKKVGTEEFTKTVIANLGKLPSSLPVHKVGGGQIDSTKRIPSIQKKKQLIGVDVGIDANNLTFEDLNKLKEVHEDFKLHLIAQKGFKIWPNNEGMLLPALELINCRYIGYQDAGVNNELIAQLYRRISELNFDITSLNSLYMYDTEIGFTKAQGE